MPQPHLIFDDKEMWTLDHVRGDSSVARSGLPGTVAEQREVASAEYRKGFKINPCTDLTTGRGPVRGPLHREAHAVSDHCQ